MSSRTFEFVRAVRGPVILLTLGILFSMDQMEGIGFRRTWPVLLVVYGVMKLIERLLAPPLPPPPAYYPPAQPWVQPPPPPPPPPATGGYRS